MPGVGRLRSPVTPRPPVDCLAYVLYRNILSYIWKQPSFSGQKTACSDGLEAGRYSRFRSPRVDNWQR